ncbi:Uncharacterized protein FWK35_00031058 [Aphis craccivora]|uniref:Uncharacterized protein n=1 Tax=Aphis craccivora TaxID=307492 RepID=A0A6G0YHZ2_APHCR|nr:Uncharacterized protein FWK35_00031058 [Aphis craccivora]
MLFLNSERSDECIDFTMIITSRNNAQISNFAGGFRWKSEYPCCIIEVKSKHFPTVFKEIEKEKKSVRFESNDSTKQFANFHDFDEFLSIFELQTLIKKICVYYFDWAKKILSKFSPYVPYEFSNLYEICRKSEICKLKIQH